jgi:hypothetical protein
MVRILSIHPMSQSRRIRWREILSECPDWVYAIDEDSEYVDEKQKIYYWFEESHYDYLSMTYAELIVTRDASMSSRPDWMNTALFLDYENRYLLYRFQLSQLQLEWNAKST